MYTNQRMNKKIPEAYFVVIVPPSSPPKKHLLAISTMKQTIATARNTTTENDKAPAFC